MKTFTRITGFILLLFAANTVTAQYYEFVENKGQWDERVKFKGSIPNGNFYLEAAGYKIVQHNADDLQKMSEFYGGHNHNSADGGHGGGGKHPDHNSTLRTSTPGGSVGSGSSGSSSLTVRSHAYEVTFVGAAKRSAIVPDKKIESYYNYFIGKDSSKWATGCNIYQAVTYTNIYPNIDVRYYNDNEHLKYDIIVRPGGNVNDIALQFDGADKLELQKGDLKIRTSTGDITELKPYTYEVQAAGKKTVETGYIVRGNIVKFRVDNYDPNVTLVIDPNLVFSTFTGSTSDNWGFTATYDGLGNLYAGGIVFGGGFPVSNGAYQTTFKGGNDLDNTAPCDIAIMKFNATGRNRIFATYIGGSGNEQPHSMIVDHANNLIIAGRTNSDNFPSTYPVHGDGGGFDIFLTKLNSTGTALIGSRRIGGKGSDGVNVVPKYEQGGAKPLRPNYGDDARSEVIIDANDNVYLAAQTRSSDFLTTSNAFQKTFGGVQDGVVLKTSPNLSNVLFSSFLGGTQEDAAFVLALHPVNSNIYVAGATVSGDFPGRNNGPVMNSTFRGGVSDGFVSIISNDGSTLVKTSYFGTDQEDLIFGIQFDRYGFPYIMGTTKGSWPVVNAAFSQAGGKQFISKLDANLTAWQYSTVFGPNRTQPCISPTAFLVDRCENVYVSGWGGGINQSAGYNNSGTFDLTTTPDAESSSTDGADFYFFVLRKDAVSQLYGSFFGQRGGMGDHVDGGTSRFDQQGIIYQALCANCGGSAGSPFQVVYPTSAGAWASTNGALAGRGCNLAALKIAFNLAGVGTSIRASIEGTVKKTGCIPMVVDFRDTIAQAKKYIWNFGDGSPEQTTTVATNQHTYTVVGQYTVRLVAIDSGTCNVADTAYITIKAGDNKATLGYNYQKLPPCTALNYEFTNTSTATLPFTATSFVWRMGDNTEYPDKGMSTFTHAYPSPGTYNVTLSLNDDRYCNYPDSITKQIRIAINVKAQFETPPSGCAPYDAVFNNTSLGGQQFLWDFGDGTTSTDEYPAPHRYTNPGTYNVTLTATDPTTCNVTDKSAAFQIVVSEGPIAEFSFTPNQAIKNTPFVFTNATITNRPTSYLWLFGDGEGVETAKRDTSISHIYNVSGNYVVRLIATNNYGCKDTAAHDLSAIIVPLIDVPNAFTPNGDGINDRVRLRGYGIAKMVFRIYNRWGALMYESITNKDMGWDGRFKGVLQPQDVYGYIADIEFTDGRRYQKKGDITLLR